MHDSGVLVVCNHNRYCTCLRVGIGQYHVQYGPIKAMQTGGCIIRLFYFGFMLYETYLIILPICCKDFSYVYTYLFYLGYKLTTELAPGTK